MSATVARELTPTAARWRWLPFQCDIGAVSMDFIDTPRAVSEQFQSSFRAISEREIEKFNEKLNYIKSS